MYPIHMAIKTKNADMVKLIAKPNNVNIILNLETNLLTHCHYLWMQQCNSETIKIY